MATSNYDKLENQNFTPEINYDDIEILGDKAVGEGSFGVVFRGRWKNKLVAVKNITHDDEKKAFVVEVRQLSRVNHPNIVTLYGACTKGPKMCLVMEYAEGGSLFNVLHCSPHIRYTLAHAMSWLYQCACGVEYLHNMKPKPLIHRDLKPPNLLLINGGRHLKICDFGTAADKSTHMTNNKGSAAWMAPEVFASDNYTEKCDVFSWGIILWEVLSRRKPYYSNGVTSFTILWSVHQGKRPPLIKNCPKCIEKLMTQCWHQIPANRPSMSELVEIMYTLCSILPGADECIQEDDDSFTEDSYYEQEGETMSSTEYESFPQDLNKTKTQNSLPQPTLDSLTPLSIEIDPNAWDLDNPNLIPDHMQNVCGLQFATSRNGSSNSAESSLHPTMGDNSSATDSDLENVYLFLDSPLRPATPDPNDPRSMNLFEEHKQLAQEYFKVQTELVLLSQEKNKILEEQLKQQEDQEETESLEDLENELVSLYKLKNFLITQKENLQNGNRGTREDWPFVNRTHN